MTQTSVQPFDVTSHIRNKVRETIIEAIPDGQMDAMIQSEFEAFFKAKTGYGREAPSEFSRIVSSELDSFMRKSIGEWLDSNFKREWNDGIQRMVGETVAELALVVQNRIVVDITQQALVELRSRL